SQACGLAAPIRPHGRWSCAGFTSPRPKSDISDLGHFKVPNSGKPEFGWGEVGSRSRDPGEGDPHSEWICHPLTRNGRAKRAHSDLSPTGRGEERLRQSYCKKVLVQRLDVVGQEAGVDHLGEIDVAAERAHHPLHFDHAL